MKNIIQFRNGFVNLPQAKNTNLMLSMSVASEVMQFGYILDGTAINNLTAASKEDIVIFHNEIITWLKQMTGSNRSYKPFWKGFPEEVMQKSESELWFHQIVHYISNGSYEPSEWTKERKTAFEHSKYTIIKGGTEDDFLNIFTRLVSVNSSLTPDDLEIVKYFVSSGVELRMPDVIPFKETLCVLAGMELDVPVKTVTDVLRIAIHMSGGDTSLPKVPAAKVRTNSWSTALSDNPLRDNFKFRKFKRSERKHLLGLLEKTNCDSREAKLKAQRWIRLGEILHPGEFKATYPKAFRMFDQIRNEKVKSWYGEVDASFKVSFKDGVSKLAERPGEFVRRLDWMLRFTDYQSTELKNFVFEKFLEIAPNVSNKVLYETLTHFEKRKNPTVGRSVMPKGARKRTTLPELPAINNIDLTRLTTVIDKGLTTKFASLTPLGKVWLDEELKKIPLPTNMRSLNSALKPTIRGQRVPIGNQDAKVIRAFVHWFDERGSRDIDLSATFIGMGKSAMMSYNTSHNTAFGCHSGDIRHRQGACAEYIDINIAECKKAGFKYVILDVRNFNGGTLAEITDCVFGYMEREHQKANEIFLPATLANTVKLQSEASTSIMAVIDVETREYIFLDLDSEGIPVASANFDKIMEAIKPYCELPAVSVYDLLEMHVSVRGELVTDAKDADTVLDFPKFSESYVETLQWMGV
jgi:hypothetical protein